MSDDDLLPWAAPALHWRLASPERYPVGDSPDLRRVAALPRRPVPDLAGPTGAAQAQAAAARPCGGPARRTGAPLLGADGLDRYMGD